MTTRFKFTERNPQPLVDLHLVERMQLIDWWTDKSFPWTKSEAHCLRLALFLNTQEKIFLIGSRNTEQIFFKNTQLFHTNQPFLFVTRNIASLWNP